ncbi:MAG: pyridoxamine 5'-phosphate oxidase family protein [Tatlockia sp.]|nr:pyridoxamine 5'-phosphate oxidase family protein [Tatlockia sp.]
MIINSAELISTIKGYLHNWFHFPHQKLFCQVATVKSGKPQLRTMGLYDFTSQGSLIFLTDTSSPKWRQIAGCANVSVCILNPSSAQILVEGVARLHTSQSNLSMATLYWQHYLDQYWRDFYQKGEARIVKNTIPASFGIVQIIPETWEVLTMNCEDYLRGSRTSYECQGNLWTINQHSLV